MTRNVSNLPNAWHPDWHAHTVFDGALQQELGYPASRDIGIPLHVERSRTARVVEEIQNRLDQRDPTGKTGFASVRMNGLQSVANGDRFLLRAEPSPASRSHGRVNEGASEHWLERSAEEVRLHLLLQSRFRALQATDIDGGDSLCQADIKRHSDRHAPYKNPEPVHQAPADTRPKKRRRSFSLSWPTLPSCFRPPKPPRPEDYRPLFSGLSANTSSTPDPAPQRPPSPAQTINRPSFDGPSSRQLPKDSPPQAGSAVTGAFHIAANSHGNFEFHDAEKPNGLFSNFWSGMPVELHGQQWPTVEHFFQAQKFMARPADDFATLAKKAAIRQEILHAPTPAQAKQIAFTAPQARQVAFNFTDWDHDRVNVMCEAVFAKFKQCKQAGQTLLQTGGRTLAESMPSNRNDFFWGAKRSDGSGNQLQGANLLGQILMQVRSDLRHGRTTPSPGARFDFDPHRKW